MQTILMSLNVKTTSTNPYKRQTLFFLIPFVLFLSKYALKKIVMFVLTPSITILLQ